MNSSTANLVDPNVQAMSVSAITSASSSTPSSPSNSKPKLKRNRTVLSCQPCHRRKQQCDRGRPCQRCIKRDSPEECVYEAPKPPRVKTPDVPHPDGLSERVTQLESLIQNTLGSMEPTALAGLDALLQLVHASNVISTPVTGSSEPGAAEQVARDHAVQVAAAALGQLSQGFSAVPSQSTVPGPISEILSHFRNGNISSVPTSVTDLESHFPNHTIVTFLLRHFFDSSSVPWFCAAIHQPLFDSCYLAFSSGPHPPSLDFVALLAIVCAVALQFLPETNQDMSIFAGYQPGRHILKKRLYNFARSVLITSETTPFPSIERIQALVLLAIYQQNHGNLLEYHSVIGMAIHMAQSLGMNRDASKVWSMKPFDAEIRRRLWWTLFTLDRFQCINLRRPYMIFEQHCDVMIPLNIDQFELTNGHEAEEAEGKPLDQLTDYTFHLFQIRWAQIITRIWDQCFCINLPTYRSIIDIEDGIRKFEFELPASFRSQSMQGALVRPYTLFQNQFLTSQIYHMRVLILRSFLFIRPPEENLHENERKLAAFHLHAKVVCLTFCKRLLAMLQIVQTQVQPSQLRWCSLAMRAFDPALTLATAILVDPTNSQNEELYDWILQAQYILRRFGTYNAIAPSAVEGLEVIRKRVEFALHPLSATVANDMSTVHPAHYIERSTLTLSLPQPCISDLLGQKEAADTLWDRVEGGVFTGNFPGMGFLYGHSTSQTLDEFLDNFISTQI